MNSKLHFSLITTRVSDFIFYSLAIFIALVLSGGIDYAEQNKLLEVANLVLFDQLKELEAENVQFRRHVERKNLGITQLLNGQHPHLAQKNKS